MKTTVLDANKQENIELCAYMIKSGDLVAFPTETVYGLGANALDEDSVTKIFTIKSRPEDNPLIVHVSSVEEVKPLVKAIPEIFEKLTDKYWPGPLTLIMQKSEIIPDNVTAGLKTVAIRMPSHPAALALIRTAGSPLAAPSANPSGRPSPTKASHVLNDIGGRIRYILDGGDCDVGIESTVLDISGDIPRILRPGYVTFEELKEVLGNVEIIETDKVDEKAAETTKTTKTTKTTESAEATKATVTAEAPKSPGMKYRHYAPITPLTAIIGSPEETAKYIAAHMNDNTAAILFDDHALSHPNVIKIGQSDDYTTQASRLFDALRRADTLNTSVIYVQVPSEEGLGIAIANRIKKAAGSNLVYL